MDDWTKNVLLAAALLVPVAGAHAACDAEQIKAALRVQAMLNEFSSAVTTSTSLVVVWGSDFASLPADKQKSMIRGYADTDACLHGSSRRIVFTRDEKLLAIATPEDGVQFVK